MNESVSNSLIMKKVWLLICLFISVLTLQGCGTPVAQIAETENSSIAAVNQAENPPPKGETQTFSDGKVDFKGVSFDYSPQVFSEITAEEKMDLPLDNETDKPDSVMPKHISLTVKVSNIKSEGTIKIIPIKDYRRMYAVSKQLAAEFDDQLEDVKKEIRGKKILKKNDLTVLPFWDGHNMFIAKLKRLSFSKGRGVYWVRQWTQDFASLINNEDLTFFYQGISDDNNYYILAELPVTAPFLPASQSEMEFEGYKLPMYYPEYEKHRKEYENYVAKITKRLEVLPQDKFEPNLSEFERIISSLKIEK